MHSQSACGASASRALVILFACVCSLPAARADSLFNDSEARHGKILEINAKGVTFVQGCGAELTEHVDWNKIDDIVFDAKCDSGGVKPAAAGGGICQSGVSTRFVIFAKDDGKPRVADEVVSGRDGTFHYTDRAKNIVAHGPLIEISGLSHRQVCGDEVMSEVPITSFCAEPVQFAANFSYDAPLNNLVLTRGFSFHTEFLPNEDSYDDNTRERIISTIRTGFGTALTNWFSGLLRRRATYDPQLQAFVASLVSKSSSGLMMLLPPQVIALRCPQAATFIVRVYGKAEGPFAADRDRKVAYAEKPGRTLVLNFADYPCWTQGYFKFVFDAAKRCVNIDPILTHELGHAFGLNHVKEDDSIMTPYIRVTQPSDNDVDRLARQFLADVQGDSPGVISFTTDNGVSVEETR